MQKTMTASGGLGTDGQRSGVQVHRRGGAVRPLLLSGGAAVATHLAVLIALTELAGMPSTLASAVGFAYAVPVNYADTRAG